MPDQKKDLLAAIETARTKFKKKIQKLRTSTRKILTEVETERETQTVSSIRKNIERQ